MRWLFRERTQLLSKMFLTFVSVLSVFGTTFAHMMLLSILHEGMDLCEMLTDSSVMISVDGLMSLKYPADVREKLPSEHFR